MRHRFGNAKLKRDVGARNSLLKNLTTSVVLEERVITTVPKAKAIQPMVEKMITLAKRDSLHTRRQAASFLTTPASVKKLFDTLGARFGQRNGGYTRITRLGPRKGDGAELAMLNWSDRNSSSGPPSAPSVKKSGSRPRRKVSNRKKAKSSFLLSA